MAAFVGPLHFHFAGADGISAYKAQQEALGLLLHERREV